MNNIQQYEQHTTMNNIQQYIQLYEQCTAV